MTNKPALAFFQTVNVATGVYFLCFATSLSYGLFGVQIPAFLRGVGDVLLTAAFVVGTVGIAGLAGCGIVWAITRCCR